MDFFLGQRKAAAVNHQFTMAVLLALLSVASLFASASCRSQQFRGSSNVNAFEELKKHGLPIGLLPDIITSAVLNDDGSFVVHLSKTCRASVANTGQVPLYYDRQLTGTIQYGKLVNLRGITAKPPELFFWVPVRSIYMDNPPSDSIHFSIGFGLTEDLPLKAFSFSPDCVSSAKTHQILSDITEEAQMD